MLVNQYHPSRDKRRQLFSGLTATMLLLAGLVNPAQAEKLTKVIVEPVEAWQKGIDTALFCQVSTPFVYQLASHADAELTQVLPVGSRVEKGAQLAQQDPFYLGRDIEIKKVDLQQANTELAYHQAEFERLASLKQQDMTSASRHNRLKLQLQSAKLKQQRLQQQLDVLNRRFAHLHHYAPFAGQVVKLAAQPGQQLGQGDAILTLLPLQQKQLECKLPLNIYQQLDNLEQLSFAFEQQPLPLREFSEQLDEKSQSITLFFDHTPAMPAVLVGQRLQLNMLQQRDNASRIPYDAVKLESNKSGARTYTTWMVDPSDQAVKVPLKILATSTTHFIVESTLKAGDRVIVRGAQRLKPEQKVAPIEKGLL